MFSFVAQQMLEWEGQHALAVVIHVVERSGLLSELLAVLTPAWVSALSIFGTKLYTCHVELALAFST